MYRYEETKAKAEEEKQRMQEQVDAMGRQVKERVQADDTKLREAAALARNRRDDLHDTGPSEH